MLPLDPPVPLSATWFDSTSTLRVVFDQLLQAGTSAIGNWQICVQGLIRSLWDNAVPLTIDRHVVTGKMLINGICFGVDRLEYNAAPADVLGRTGVPAAAFSGFPLTFVP